MRTLARFCFIALAALMLTLTSFSSTNVFAQAAPTAGQLIISEFRFRGPSGASDEFIEIYNNTNTSIDAGNVTIYSLQSGGTNANLITTLPSPTIIPARSFYLYTNNTATTGYSLTDYASANRSTTSGITDNTGIALCASATLTNCINVTTGAAGPNRLDAVGFTTAATGQTARPGFTEGVGITPAASSTPTVQFSFVRRMESGNPIDTNNNRNDFVLVSTSGAALNRTSTTPGPDGPSILGAPGPQNLTSPRRNSSVTGSAVPGVPSSSYDSTATAPTVAPAGTIFFNRRYTNNTGGTVTRLRLRVIDITTLNSPNVIPAGSSSTQQAILRVRDGANVTVNGMRALTLEPPSSTTNGGGLNSSLVYGTFATPEPIPAGASVNVQFQVGVQQGGYYRFFTIVEAAVEPPVS